MLRFTVLLTICAALLGSCTTYHDTSRQRLETLPHHYSQFDVHLAWESRVSGGETLIDGVAKNVRYAYMYGLEIWVAVLDAQGKSVARSVSFIIPRQLNLDETAEFSLKLPLPAPPGTKLRFTYKYRGSDGGGGERHEHGDGGIPWMQSFETVVQ